ncbi:MAG: hypothetical protein VX130_00645 [Verrucomicrobiota bacterium]|nr:hypothetical protein [Verrucomicrobiota bacterium]
MKICFITGQKDSRQTGITDYVELIAKELEKLGYKIERYFIKKEFRELTDLPNADVYSIQFAPYAFAAKGIPNQILKCLCRKLQHQKVHLNFHEIWVGDYPRASWKEKGMGWLQRSLVLGFIKKCKPIWITSSNAAAIDRLNRAGITTRFLYLFGNIPLSSTHEVKITGQTLKVAFFGTAYADFPYDKLNDFFSVLSKSCGKKLEIIMIGRQREDAGTERVLSICKKNHFLTQTTGELSTNLISEQLQKCGLGVSTTPYDVIGKSGATAAMLEHGLPVLAYDDGDTAEESLFIPEPFKDQIFLINDDSSAKRLLNFMDKPRKSFFDGVAHTANKMLDMIS